MNNDSHEIWEYYTNQEMRIPAGKVGDLHGDANPTVTCFCNDCVSWLSKEDESNEKAGKCTAGAISLAYDADDPAQLKCVCQNYRPKGEQQ